MKTFKQFLADKSISDEDWKAKTAEEMAALHKEYNEAVQKEIADAIANKTDEKAVKSLIDNAIKGIEGFATSDQVKNLEDILKKQGETLTNLKGGVNGGNSLSAQIRKFFEDNQEKIREIKSAGHGMLELELKEPELITTGNATIVGDVPNIAGIQQAGASNVNLRGTFVEDLVNTIQTNLAAYPYTETLPKDGDFEFVAEGEVKPQIDFEIETEYAKPYKIAAWVKLTDEAVEDIDGLEDIARNYLRKKHDLKKQKAILIGDGSAGAPLGAAEIGRTFNAGAMAGMGGRCVGELHALKSNGVGLFVALVKILVHERLVSYIWVLSPNYPNLHPLFSKGVINISKTLFVLVVLGFLNYQSIRFVIYPKNVPGLLFKRRSTLWQNPNRTGDGQTVWS